MTDEYAPLAKLDAAFEAEIQRVSTLEYNSNSICRKFYGELRRIFLDRLREDAHLVQNDGGDAARYRGLRTLLYSQNIDIGEAELSLHFYGSAPTLEQFDAAIDAAMESAQ